MFNIQIINSINKNGNNTILDLNILFKSLYTINSVGFCLVMLYNIIKGYPTKYAMHSITFGFSSIALKKSPFNAMIVARVIPHPGHGMWYSNLEGQTEICVCPLDVVTTTSHAITTT